MNGSCTTPSMSLLNGCTSCAPWPPDASRSFGYLRSVVATTAASLRSEVAGSTVAAVAKGRMWSCSRRHSAMALGPRTCSLGRDCQIARTSTRESADGVQSVGVDSNRETRG